MTQDEINAVKKAAEKMRKQESAQDEIIDMAIQAGASPDENKIWLMYAEEIEAFAKLVAAKKQERIIEVVERLGTWAHITEVIAEIKGEA